MWAAGCKVHPAAPPALANVIINTAQASNYTPPPPALASAYFLSVTAAAAAVFRFIHTFPDGTRRQIQSSGSVDENGFRRDSQLRVSLRKLSVGR